MASFTPTSAACGARAPTPSSTMDLADSRSLSGAGPQTSTSTAVPRLAASSTALRLSSSRARRSAAVVAGNMPPLQRLETLRPASRTMRALSDNPVSETLSRHRPIQGIPARTHPSVASLTLQPFVVFWLRLSRDSSGESDTTSHNPCDGEHQLHTFGGEVGVLKQPGVVCEDKELGEVCHRACPLLPTDHPKVILVSVQVGQEHDTRLVEAGRGFEDVAAQGHGWREYLLVALRVSHVEGLQGRRSRGSDGVEDAKEGVGEAFFVAPDQLGVSKVVARVHPDTCREAAAYLDLAAGLEERDFDTVDLLGVVADDREAYFRGRVEVTVAPVAAEGRVEHLSEPVDDHG